MKEVTGSGIYSEFLGINSHTNLHNSCSVPLRNINFLIDWPTITDRVCENPKGYGVQYLKIELTHC